MLREIQRTAKPKLWPSCHRCTLWMRTAVYRAMTMRQRPRSLHRLSRFPAAMQFRQSTVEDSEVDVDAAAVQQAGGELHADVAAALPAHSQRRPTLPSGENCSTNSAGANPGTPSASRAPASDMSLTRHC